MLINTGFEHSWGKWVKPYDVEKQKKNAEIELFVD
jgi:hypothetical protein